jgi:hypothetical protein
VSSVREKVQDSERIANGGVKMSRHMRNGLTRHHIRPLSRSHDNRAENILLVPAHIHEAYHLLFGNAMPWEAIAIIRRDWTKAGTYGDRRK